MSNEKPANEYVAMIAVLEAKKAALESAIASLRFVASGAGPIPNSGVAAADLAGTISPAGATIGSVDDIPNGAFHGKSIAEAAILYLEMIKKKQTSKEIAEALLRGGMETTSPTFQTNVQTILKRTSAASGTIVRIGDAWGLPGWYHPGLRASQPKPANGGKKKVKRVKKAVTKQPKQKALAGLAKPAGVQDQIVTFLREGTAGYSAEHIAEAIGAKKQTVYLVLGKLEHRKEVTRTDDGVYHYRQISVM